MCGTTAILWIAADFIDDQILNLPSEARVAFRKALQTVPAIHYCIPCRCWGIYTVEAALVFSELVRVIGLDFVWNDGESRLDLLGIHKL